jgi:hemoglobin
MELPITPQSRQQSDAAPQQSFSADNTPFAAIGGVERVRELVDRFYLHMEHDAEYAATRALYPAGDLAPSRQKLFEFLVGWLGGPQMYIEKHGHPRLRARHMPFAIDQSARDHWLSCMTLAMNEMKIDGDLRAFLDQRFRHVATFLINR